AIINSGINHYASGEAAAGLHEALKLPTGLSALAADPAIRAVFNASLHWSFWGVVVVALLARPDRDQPGGEEGQNRDVDHA
ncbi:hypothetical protein ACCT11_36235, partial [Rhizobium johnstonii]